MRSLKAHNEREAQPLADLLDTLVPRLMSGELRMLEADVIAGRAT
jgi:hypothetical protein